MRLEYERTSITTGPGVGVARGESQGQLLRLHHPGLSVCNQDAPQLLLPTTPCSHAIDLNLRVHPHPQLPVKGGKGGYRESYPLADASRCAVGGWDIRLTPLGDALYESHVLDYDLVRQARGWVGGWGCDMVDGLYGVLHVLTLERLLHHQVRDHLNSKVEVMKGVWNPSFIGESQHATATHVVDCEKTTHAQAVEILRGDIQR